jgi:hypothetical protein
MKRVGLSTAIAAAILCAAWAPAHAQQQQYGQPGTYVTWGTNTTGQNIIDVTYFVGGGMTATQANLIRQAAAAWNNTGAFVHLVEVGSSVGANAVFQIGAVPPGTLFISPNVPTTGVQPGLLNGSPWVQINGQAVITLNSAIMPLVWDGSTPQPALYWDFNTLALQMVGYALGLGPAFAGDPNSVMNPTVPFNTGFTAPTPADAASLLAVYGSPEPATFALFGVGLAALGFSRKFRRR